MKQTLIKKYFLLLLTLFITFIFTSSTVFATPPPFPGPPSETTEDEANADYVTTESPASSSNMTSDVIMTTLAMPKIQTKRELKQQKPKSEKKKTSKKSKSEAKGETSKEEAAESEQKKEESEEETTSSGTPMTFSGYTRYDMVKVAEKHGYIVGATAGFAMDYDDITFGLLIPYDYLDFNFLRSNRFGGILFGQYAYPILDELSLGFTGNGNYVFMDIADAKDINYYGCGLSTSATYDIGLLVGTFAASYQYTNDDSDSNIDEQHLLKLGGDIGVRLGEYWVVDIFGIWNKDLTRNDDTTRNYDDDYYDVGVEIRYSITDTFTLDGGYKKVIGCSDYESDMIYLGSNFHF